MSGTKNKNLLVIIAVLLLTNFAVLGYFLWYKKPPKFNHPGGREKHAVGDILRKDVGFDSTQIATYKEMREKQKDVLHPMFDDMRRAKDSLFSMIGKAEADDSVVLRLAAHVGDKQEKLDLQTFRYFSDVRKLCRPDQQAKYDSLMTEMFKKMGKPKGKE
ncbi:MAG: periplasmic heavy metal sensor [Chitinophagaceae bacterium]|nr:periplasmic heavy metal sensor [Chitinophagaceae bacterium]